MMTVAQEAQARRDTFKSVCNFLTEATTSRYYRDDYSCTLLADCLDLQMEVAAQLQGKDWLKFKLIPETGNRHFVAQSKEASQKALNAVVIRFLKWVERAPKLKTVAQEAQACRNTFQSIRTFLVAFTSIDDPIYNEISNIENIGGGTPTRTAKILDLQMKVAAQLCGKDWRSFRPLRMPLGMRTGDPLEPIPVDEDEEKARHFVQCIESPVDAQIRFNLLVAQFLKWAEN